MVFPVVMGGCESWTVKKAENRRIDSFELWCWRRLLRVPWTARRSNQSILKEISPGCSLEGMMLKRKLQYFGYLMRRVVSLEKTLMLGGIGGRRKTGRQRMRWLNGITDLMDVSVSELHDLVMDREAWPAAIHGVAKGWIRLRDWIELKSSLLLRACCLQEALFPSSSNSAQKRQVQIGGKVRGSVTNSGNCLFLNLDLSKWTGVKEKRQVYLFLLLFSSLPSTPMWCSIMLKTKAMRSSPESLECKHWLQDPTLPGN